MSDTKKQLATTQSEVLQVLQRTNRQASESREIGQRTLEAMNTQTAQMERICLEADDTEQILKHSMKTMKKMNRHWIRRLFCMCCTSPAQPAPTVKWHSDEATIKQMTGKDKSQYIKKRSKARETTEQEQPTTNPVEQLPRLSEEEPLSDHEFDKRVDGELDQMLHSVESLKVLAEEISLQSKVQSRMEDKLENKIHKTKDGVKANTKMMSVLAPKISKKNKQDAEYLSASDRLLVAGATASVKSKFGGL